MCPLPATRCGIHLSVIVPFYNSAAHIEACAKALVGQHYPLDRYEMTFVDNGSADGSRTILERYPRSRVLMEPKRGSYAARNRGVAASSGTILCFTDADCAPTSDWLQAIENAMRDEQIGIVLGQVGMRSSAALRLLCDYENERAQYIFSSTTAELYYGYTNNMAVRRSIFNCVGPFHEVPRGGDVILVRHVVDTYGVGSVRYEPQAAVRHLELTGLGVWIRKMFIYGRTTRRYRPIVLTRSMRFVERSEVFRRTVRRHAYSLPKRIVLFVMLAAGVGAHLLGRCTGIGFKATKEG